MPETDMAGSNTALEDLAYGLETGLDRYRTNALAALA